ncbi:MAG: hypothetical protein SW019_02880 [Actinomycetota bacterium]|nr:hypothetical protein [Actinomycetota bacterium]
MGSRRSHTDGPAASGFGRPQPPQLLVWGSGVSEIITAAGGYLCDQARCGWDVTVLLADDCDVRPLTILGATARLQQADAESVLGALNRGQGLLIGAERLARGTEVHRALSRVLSRGANDVTVWGEPKHARADAGLEPAAHRLSSAARAFKAHALAAGGRPPCPTGAVGPTESLFRIRRPLRGLYPV